MFYLEEKNGNFILKPSFLESNEAFSSYDRYRLEFSSFACRQLGVHLA